MCEVIGLHVSALPGVGYGKHYLQNLQFDKNKALKINKGNYNACMQLSKEAQDDLHCWVDHGVYSNNPIMAPH